MFWVGVVAWGFAFWSGVPGIYKLLAERSVHPADRAGDAQSVMAAGRVVGPLLGAGFIEAGSVQALGFVAAALMAGAGLTLVYVERTIPPLP